MLFNAQAPIPRRYRCIGSNGRISTDVRCHICSAAVKVTALLTLPAAAAAVLCRAARQWHHEESSRFHARLLHALLWAGRCCVVSSSSVFSKNDEASNSWSFDTEKFITEMGDCQPFGNPGDLIEMNKKKCLCVGGTVWEINWKHVFLFINSNCNSARVRTSTSTSITSTD